MPNPSESRALSTRRSWKSRRGPLIFISHDSRDSDLAAAFANLLLDCSGRQLSIFRSSDRLGDSGIKYGTEWYATLQKKLTKASAVIALLTPLSVSRPWIFYELGVAHGKSNLSAFGVSFNLDISDLPGPFQQLQTASGDSDEPLTGFVKQLIRRLLRVAPHHETVARQVALFRNSLPKVLEKSKRGAHIQQQSANLQDPPPISTEEECLRNRYRLISVETLAAEASEIVAAGVTLVSLVTPRHDYFASRLRGGTSLRFMVLDRESNAWKAWHDGQQILTPEDLDLTLRTLAPLFHGEQRDKIEVRLSPFALPISLVIADPSQLTGRMNVEFAFTGFSIIDRPHLYLSKAGSPSWFEFFVGRFEYLWAKSRAWTPEA